jgi:hypothetical protein
MHALFVPRYTLSSTPGIGAADERISNGRVRLQSVVAVVALSCCVQLLDWSRGRPLTVDSVKRRKGLSKQEGGEERESVMAYRELINMPSFHNLRREG